MKRAVFFTLIVSIISNYIYPQNPTGSFTDTRDGKVYKTIEIGNLIWFVENFDYRVNDSWYYNNTQISTSKMQTRLYTWKAAQDFCPSGWRLPTKDDWAQLIEYLGGKKVAGDKMNIKYNGYGYGAGPNKSFYGLGIISLFWSATEINDDTAWSVGVNAITPHVDINVETAKTHALSVRYVKLINSSNIQEQSQKDLNRQDSTGTVIDIDGNVYQTVKIGKQWWLAENLKVTHYRNGDLIPNVKDEEDWGNLTSSALCAYNNNENNIAIHGYIYNWYAVGDKRNIAPSGWHVPTDEEWMELEIYLGMSKATADNLGIRGTDEGSRLKVTGSKNWLVPNKLSSPNFSTNNEIGFSAYPSGRRYSDNQNFNHMGYQVYFWTSSEYYSDMVWHRALYFHSSGINRYWDNKQSGCYVRLIKD